MSEDHLEQQQPRRNHPDREAGISNLDILELPEAKRHLVNLLIRQKRMTLTELAAAVGEPETSLCQTISELVSQGFVQEMELEGQLCYQVMRASKPKRRVASDIWKALD
ncbi:MAG: hypothetical protein Fur0025_17590 [Oscillatoriaceae cyanobacterium]